MIRILHWKNLPLLLLLFLAGSTTSSTSDANSTTGSSQSCDASDGSATCRDPEQVESNTKPACSIDMKDEDVEYCLQQASLGMCSGSSEESEMLKKRCPKACRTCWSCENVSDDEKCDGKYLYPMHRAALTDYGVLEYLYCTTMRLVACDMGQQKLRSKGPDHSMHCTFLSLVD